MLSTLDDTVARCLPGYCNVRVDGEDGRDLVVDQGSATLSVRQLSDGERAILALVLDLTRRLAVAYPELRDPAAEAEAVVLVDEVELHLHPKWQRQIVESLTAAFPRCQFIATTHSPQVVGEVEADRVHVMADGEVYSPTHSFGVDSSRVLEEVMDAPPRTESVHCLLSEISRRIGKNRFDEARERGAGVATSTATPRRAIVICDGTLPTRLTASKHGCGTSSMAPFGPTTRSSTISSTEC